jgi:site-specific recombinase XerD
MNLKIFPKFEKGIILQSTVQKYQVTLNQLKDFLNARQTDDVNILSVNREFIDDFQNFLHQFNAHNSTMRHLSYFKCIMTHAVNVKGYLLKNPFDSIKLGKKKHTPVFLEESELQRIMRKKFLVDRLNKVRDLFLFQCFTGLSYADMMLFRPENVQNNYVRIYRKKSTEPAVIYVYDIAMKILEKYGNSLPKVSNQKMNGYLKEIADLCQITKNLTTHVARHTFATTVNLNNGIPIEVVQTLLGHASIKQTEHYARLQTRSVLKHCNSNNLQLNKVFNAEQLSINFTNLQNSNTN